MTAEQIRNLVNEHSGTEMVLHAEIAAQLAELNAHIGGLLAGQSELFATATVSITDTPESRELELNRIRERRERERMAEQEKQA